MLSIIMLSADSRGEGVKKDPDEANKWFSAAAAKGHRLAKRQIS